MKKKTANETKLLDKDTGIIGEGLWQYIYPSSQKFWVTRNGMTKPANGTKLSSNDTSNTMQRNVIF